MARQIRITADTAALKKSITDISKMVNKDLGKSKIELFTADTKKFLRTEALASAAALKKKIDGIKQSTMDHQKAMANVVKGSQEELKIKLKILKASQQIVDAEKEHQELQQSANSLQQSNFSKGFMKTPGIAQLANKLKEFQGMGAMGMLGGLAGAGGLAALGYGASRIYSARETWKGGVEDRLKLMGRGATDLEPSNRNAMTAAGLNALSLRQQRLQAMDVFGREGASQNAVIQRAGFERNFGLEQGTMTGIGAMLRPAMGGKEANMSVMKLQASLIASGITDAIGPYLETAASMLTELNEKGFTMDESVLALFNSMAKTGMGEGRIRQLAMGADQGIRGSTGEANAFFQSAFNRAGIGGGTIGGAQAAMRMGGLFGVDLDKYKGMGATDKRTFQTMGIGGPNHMKAVAGATLGQLDQLFGSQGEIEKQLGSKDRQTRMGGAAKRLSRLRYMMQAFGLKDEGQAAEVEGLLRKAKTATPAEQKKIMAKIKDIKEDTPELENLKKINRSTAGTYDILKNEKTSLEDAIGETLGDYFNEANQLLNSIDKAILALAKFITGYQTPEERQAEIKGEQADQAKSGKAAAQRILQGQAPLVGSPDLKDITQGMSYEDQIAFGKQVKQKMEGEKDKGFFKNSMYEQVYNSPEFKYIRKGIEGEERRKIREGNQRGGMSVGPTTPEVGPGNQPQYMTPAQPQNDKKTHSLLEGILRHSKITAENSKEKGTLKPGSSSTTGN